VWLEYIPRVFKTHQETCSRQCGILYQDGGESIDIKKKDWQCQKDCRTSTILQTMPEQLNYQSELSREIYRATSSLGVRDSRMPHNGSNYKNTIKRTKRTNKHQNNHKNTLVNRLHQTTILNYRIYVRESK
jgi:hypothetical protein